VVVRGPSSENSCDRRCPCVDNSRAVFRAFARHSCEKQGPSPIPGAAELEICSEKEIGDDAGPRPLTPRAICVPGQG